MGTCDIVLLCVLVFLLGVALGFLGCTLVIVSAMREKKNKPIRVQQKEHPCASCLRWSECNGVDDDCPIRR